MGPRNAGNPPPCFSTPPRPPDLDEVRRKRIQIARAQAVEQAAVWRRDLENTMASFQSELLNELRQFRLELIAQVMEPSGPTSSVPIISLPVTQSVSSGLQLGTIDSYKPHQQLYMMSNPPLSPAAADQHQPPVYNVVQNLTSLPAHTDRVVTPPPLAQFTSSPLPLLDGAPPRIHPPKIQISFPPLAQPTTKPPLLDGAVSTQPNSSPASFCSVSGTNTSASNPFNCHKDDCGGMGFAFGANGIDEKLENGKSVEKRAEVTSGDGREFSEIECIIAKQDEGGLVEDKEQLSNGMSEFHALQLFDKMPKLDGLCNARRNIAAVMSIRDKDDRVDKSNVLLGDAELNCTTHLLGPDDKDGNCEGSGEFGNHSRKGLVEENLVANPFEKISACVPEVSNFEKISACVPEDSNQGLSINNFDLNGKSYPLIWGGDAANFSAGANSEIASFCPNGALNSHKVKGKIVFCETIDDGSGVLLANGVGTIMADSSSSDLALNYPLAATVVKIGDGQRIMNYIRSTANPNATILVGETDTDIMAPVVVSFSSRGPNPIIPDILKPDLTAPGVDILAAWCLVAPPSIYEDDTRSVEFNVISGTSMSCPHASGVAAYVKAAHPNWSPAAIKSALMTTAHVLDPKRHEDLEFAYVQNEEHMETLMFLCASSEFGTLATLNAWLNGNFLLLPLENKLEKMNLLLTDKLGKRDKIMKMMFVDNWESWKYLVIAANKKGTEDLHSNFLENHLELIVKCLRYVLSTWDALYTMQKLGFKFYCQHLYQLLSPLSKLEGGLEDLDRDRNINWERMTKISVSPQLCNSTKALEIDCLIALKLVLLLPFIPLQLQGLAAVEDKLKQGGISDTIGGDLELLMPLLFSGVKSYGNTHFYICYVVGNLSHKYQAAQLQNQRQKQNSASGENKRYFFLFRRILFPHFISELVKGDQQLQFLLTSVFMFFVGEAFTSLELLQNESQIDQAVAKAIVARFSYGGLSELVASWLYVSLRYCFPSAIPMVTAFLLYVASVMCVTVLGVMITIDKAHIDEFAMKAKKKQLGIVFGLYEEKLFLTILLQHGIFKVGGEFIDDGNFIAQLINSEHQTCPKSGQKIIHMALLPNYALKSLLHQWCEEHKCLVSLSRAFEIAFGGKKVHVSQLEGKKTVRNNVAEVIADIDGKIYDISVIMQLVMVLSTRPMDEVKGIMCIVHESLAGNPTGRFDQFKFKAFVLIITFEGKLPCKWLFGLPFSRMVFLICRLIDWKRCQGYPVVLKIAIVALLAMPFIFET